MRMRPKISDSPAASRNSSIPNDSPLRSWKSQKLNGLSQGGLHLMPSHRGQHVFREAADLVHEHLVRHRALVELHEQHVRAERFAERDELVADFRGRAPAKALVLPDIVHRHLPESLQRPQERLAILRPQPAEPFLANVAGLALAAHIEEVAVTEERVEEVELVGPGFLQRL